MDAGWTHPQDAADARAAIAAGVVSERNAQAIKEYTELTRAYVRACQEDVANLRLLVVAQAEAIAVLQQAVGIIRGQILGGGSTA